MPNEKKVVINGLVYDPDTEEVIATNDINFLPLLECHIGGKKCEPHEPHRFLFKAPEGHFFVIFRGFEGELMLVSAEEAEKLYRVGLCPKRYRYILQDHEGGIFALCDNHCFPLVEIGIKREG